MQSGIGPSARTVLLHADWSKHPRKRWACRAQLVGSRYRVGAPTRITPDEVLATLREPRAMAGFDFPIGIPAAYAHEVNAPSFLDWLSELGKGPYASFFDVAKRKEDISLHRPFYPDGSTGVKQDHLARALGIPMDGLFRRCDVAQGRRACALFWTLGGNQVGKAALAGWREVLIPAIRMGAAVWPFAGSLDALLGRDASIVVETYPADVYRAVGASLPVVRENGHEEHGKRSRASRRASAEGIQTWTGRAGLELAPELVAMIDDGFGADECGEDRFDAVIGLFGMVAVLRGERDCAVPDDDDVQRREGWILGRRASMATCHASSWGFREVRARTP